MAGAWTSESILDAVRRRVPQVSVDGDVPMRPRLDGDDLLMTFRWRDRPELYAVRFPLSDVPKGPSTGEVCASPEEWAQEVSWVLMEELGTGLMRWGRRTVGPDGLVELDYRNRVDDGSGTRHVPLHDDGTSRVVAVREEDVTPELREATRPPD